jgi:NADP-dependent alcohol dehydrogenase
MQAVAQIREGGFDFLLAVGGGSVIDAPNSSPLPCCLRADPWAILLKRRAQHQKSHALWRGAHAARHGLGNEQRLASSRTATRAPSCRFSSPHTYPKFSVLDPTKTYTLPPQQLANGVVDAFVHTVEQYLTYPVNALCKTALPKACCRP